MEIILGLDIGDSRVGIAKSDALGIKVSPLKTVKPAEVQVEIKKLQEEYSIEKIIVGLPKNMDGTEGEQAQKTRAFVKELEKSLSPIELIFEDERLTSEAATERIKEQGIKITQHNKEIIDMHAAAIILEQYINRQNPS